MCRLIGETVFLDMEEPVLNPEQDKSLKAIKLFNQTDSYIITTLLKDNHN